MANGEEMLETLGTPSAGMAIQEPDAASEFQTSAFEAQNLTMPDIAGPSALKTPEAMGGGKMNKTEWLARGGLGNTVMQALQMVRNGTALQKQKEAYQSLHKQGYRGARKLYEDAVKKYPGNEFDEEGISAWVPRPEFFVKKDGTFDGEKYHQAFRLGLYNYKRNLLNRAKEVRLDKKEAGYYSPEQQQAIKQFDQWVKQNPSATAEERSQAWNSLSGGLKPPSQILGRTGMAGALTSGQISSQEEMQRRAATAHERALERIRLAAQLRSNMAGGTASGSLNPNQVLTQLRLYTKERLKLAEQIAEHERFQSIYKDNGMEEQAKKHEDTKKRLAEENKLMVNAAKGLISEYKSRDSYLKDLNPEYLTEDVLASLDTGGQGLPVLGAEVGGNAGGSTSTTQTPSAQKKSWQVRAKELKAQGLSDEQIHAQLKSEGY